jgi:DNA-binding SARP family transcriptional activator
MRTPILVFALVLAACGAKETRNQAEPVERLSVALHLDLAAVYERHSEIDRAIFHYEHALAGQAESGPAALGLARLTAARGDPATAIATLERAWREGKASQAAAPEVFAALLGLYTDAGDLAAAETLVAVASDAAAGDTLALASVHRAWIARLQQAALVEEKITELEHTADPSERDLRLLATAYRAIGAGGTESLAAVYERLVAMNPDDQELRRALAVTYQSLGRPDDARRHLDGMPQNQACPQGFGTLPRSDEIAREEDLVALLLAQGRVKEARSAIERVRKLGARAGVVAPLVAAIALGKLGDAKAAGRVFAEAAKAAKSSDEERAVAVARARWLSESGQEAARAALFAAWQSSPDACLRLEASRQIAVANLGRVP